jgi:hypothetical protein
MKGLMSRRLGFVAVLGLVVALAGVLTSASGAGAVSGTVRVGSLITSVGLAQSVNLEALDVGAPGLGAWTIDVVYDPSVVSAVSCTAEQGGICNPTFADDTFRVAGLNIFGLEGDTALGTVSFACESVGTTDLTLTLDVFVDATLGGPLPIDATIENGTVTCLEEGTLPPPGPVGLPGDANCDGNVDSIDAALILQFEAEILDSVPCPEDADSNDDGAINSIDAAIILQSGAGLLA